MIKSSGRNVGNYFIGETEEINQPDGRDEVIGQKNKETTLRLVVLLLARKIKVVQCNIKSSNFWWKGYYMHTKVQLRYKQKNRTKGLDLLYDTEYDYTSRFPIGFRGCFVCGATYHFRTNDCPFGINNTEKNERFWKSCGLINNIRKGRPMMGLR